MLTLYEFHMLNDQEKSKAVFLEGTYIDDRADDAHRIQFYRLYNFYVEVYYDAIKNEVTRYRSFNRLGQLAPYIAK